MPAIRNGSYQAVFNDTSDPTYVKPNQCIAFKRVCECGTRFPLDSDHCPVCGAVRPRCQNTAMEGEHTCRTHSNTRPYSLYSKVAGMVSDTALEEVVADIEENRDLSEEYAMTKLIFAKALEQHDSIPVEKLMRIAKMFFDVADKKHNIESGQILNVSWNDDLANALRNKMKKVLKVFTELIMEYVPEEYQSECLRKLKERSVMVGNMRTVMEGDEDYLPFGETKPLPEIINVNNKPKRKEHKPGSTFSNKEPEVQANGPIHPNPNTAKPARPKKLRFTGPSPK